MWKYTRVVYRITHNVTKRMYVGSSGDVEKRINHHLCLLRAGKHPIEDMQYDFDMYGEDYTVVIIGEIKYTGRNLEYETMEKCNSRVRGTGYNYKDKHGIPKKTGYYTAKLELMRSGKTEYDVANAMGYSSGTLSKMLNGRREFTLDEAKQFKKIIGSSLPLEELFEEAVG